MQRILIACLLSFLPLMASAKDLPELTWSGDKPRVQNPLSPEDSQKHIQTPDGFKAVLFASEPEIINPIALSWDADGRLFVLQSLDYPHKFGKPTGGDRITICEDTDGDGRADKFTVFAEQLSIGTGLVCVDGGVIVAQAPDMKLLEDTDGDDKADKTTVLFSGFSLNDTHAGPSNLALGHDNWIWGAVGYSGFRATFGDREIRIGKGVYRFSPDGKQFEFVGQFNNNTWGLGFTESFDIFGSTANNNHCFYVGIPKRYAKDRKTLNAKSIQGHYEITKVTESPLQQVDVRGGYTAAAGAMIYTARTYPKEYWNRVMLVCEPTGHVVHKAMLIPEGAGFREEDGGNLFASSDNWSAPVYAATGPDGMVWVADWYNPVIQHNPDRRGMENQIWNADKGPGNAHLNPLRDVKHGRIYRVVYENATPQKAPSLRTADIPELLKALQHENLFWRSTAQQIIVKRQLTDAIPGLIKLTQNKDKNSLGMNPGAQHAVRILDGLGQLDGSNPDALKAVLAALKHPASDVRKAAVQVLPETATGSENLASSGVLSDPAPHTRLAAILRTMDLPEHPAVPEALVKSATAKDSDLWLSTAIGLATGSEAGSSDEPEIADASEADLTIVLKTIPEKMSYDKKRIDLPAGKKVRIVFINDDVMPHNFVLLKPGSLQAFGAEADAFLTDPKAVSRAYVPESKHVIAYTPMLDPKEKASVIFETPASGGSFPYACTFPAHWRMMNGRLNVERNSPHTINESGTRKVLIMGAGHPGHDFKKLFGQMDGAIFAGGDARVDFSGDTIEVSPHLEKAEFLVLSNNKPYSDKWKSAIFDYADSGKSMLIIHPATWYNWKDWPEYNRQIVGGGSTSHEKLGEFDVIIKKPDHPLAKGVPETFAIFDELYRWNPDPEGPGIEVIAIGRGRESGKEYPVLWVVKHPKSRVIGNTLGHGIPAHENPAYKQIIHNIRDWVLK